MGLRTSQRHPRCFIVAVRNWKIPVFLIYEGGINITMSTLLIFQVLGWKTQTGVDVTAREVDGMDFLMMRKCLI